MLVKLCGCDILGTKSFSKQRSTNSASIMSPAVTPPATSAIPEPPPPPPLPEIALPPPPTGLLDSGSASMPATPTVGSPKLSLKVPESGMRRQHSFSSLLQKFATDHHFAMEWLEHDDDAASIVSVDSVASVGSSLSGNLSRAGSYVDIREPSAGASSSASASAKPGLTAASVEKLDKKMEGMRLEPNRKKLSQAMIWTWLTSTKQNALPEDSEVMSLPKTGDLATGAAGTSQELPKDMKVNTEKLRAKLVKTYPKYYRDLNAMSPNNW